MEPKVIVIDWGIITHKAIFALKFNPSIPVTYTVVNITLGLLYKLNVDPDDTIIVACDGRNSWRKDYELQYKANRKEKREAFGIDWELCYSQIGKLTDDLKNGLSWNFIKIDRVEADDVMAAVCRYYHDQQVILVTHDKDLDQCWEYPNVRIFSTHTKKWKIKPDNFDANRLISEKIYKETTDNMVAPILNDYDYENRRLCINLLELPDWVELAIIDAIKNFQPRVDDVNAIPFKSLHARFNNMYNDKTKIIDYDLQILKESRKVEKKEKKKKDEVDWKEKTKAKIAAKFEKEQEKLKAKIDKLQKEKNNAHV